MRYAGVGSCPWGGTSAAASGAGLWAPPAVSSLDAMRGFLLLLAGALLSGLSLLLARFPGAVERVYGQTVGPWIARVLSLATGWSPVSVSWLLLLGLVLWGGWRLWSGVGRLRGGEVGWGAATLAGAGWLAGVAGILLIAFYLFWGLNYARAPVDTRLGLDSGEALDAAELRELTVHAVERTNQAYRLLHGGSDDTGTPTAVPFDPRAASAALEVGWRRVGPALGMEGVETRHYGPVKTVGITWLLDFFDLSGVYSPFTGEAHVSASLPSMVLPATAGHEQAHQRGIARENEATFAGVLAAVHADDPYVRYSGWARVVRSLQRDLSRADREAWDSAMAALSPGVRRDWGDYVRWYEENRSVGGPVATAVNDTYLRAHAVPGGIRSYDRVTTLLLQWARRYDGRLTVLPGMEAGSR